MEDDIKGSKTSSDNKECKINYNEFKHENSILQNDDKVVEDMKRFVEDSKSEIFQYELYQFKLKHELNNLRIAKEDFDKKIKEVGKYYKQSKISPFSLLLFGLLGLFCGIYFTNTLKTFDIFIYNFGTSD
jgi:hypothetical protein